MRGCKKSARKANCEKLSYSKIRKRSKMTENNSNNTQIKIK